MISLMWYFLPITQQYQTVEADLCDVMSCLTLLGLVYDFQHWCWWTSGILYQLICCTHLKKRGHWVYPLDARLSWSRNFHNQWVVCHSKHTRPYHGIEDCDWSAVSMREDCDWSTGSMREDCDWFTGSMTQWKREPRLVPRLHDSASGPLGPPGGCSAPAVDSLGAGPQLAEPQLPQPQLQVFGDLPAFSQDLPQALLGGLGEAEVTDGGVVFVVHAAGACGGVVALCADRDLVVAWVQQAPVVSVGN